MVVASGHYNVEYVPDIPGLAEWAEKWPDSVLHAKEFRRPEDLDDKVHFFSPQALPRALSNPQYLDDHRGRNGIFINRYFAGNVAIRETPLSQCAR